MSGTLVFMAKPKGTISVTLDLPVEIFMGAGSTTSGGAVVMSGRPPGAHPNYTAIGASPSITLSYDTIANLAAVAPTSVPAALADAAKQVAMLSFVVAVWNEILAFGYNPATGTSV